MEVKLSKALANFMEELRRREVKLRLKAAFRRKKRPAKVRLIDAQSTTTVGKEG